MAKKRESSRKFFGGFLFLYILTNTFFVEANPMIAHSVGLILIGSAGLFNLFSQKKPFYLNFSVISYLMFAVWSMLSYFWSLDENLHIEYQQRIVFFVIMLVSIFNVVKWHELRSCFLWGYVASGFANFLVFINIIPNTFTRRESTLRFVGTLGNSNYTAILIVLSIFASIYLLNTVFRTDKHLVKWILLLNIPACLYTIVQTGSRKGFVGGIGLLFVFFIPYLKTTRNIFYGVAFAMLLISGFNYLMEDEDFADQIGFVSNRFEGAQETIEGTGVEGSTEYRILLGKLAFDVWKDNPFVGVGMNNFRVFAGGYYSHNNYLEIMANLGIIGFALFYLIYLFCFINLLKVSDFYIKSTGLLFLFLFLLMDLGWISYTSIVYLLMLMFVTDMASMDKKVQGEKA